MSKKRNHKRAVLAAAAAIVPGAGWALPAPVIASEEGARSADQSEPAVPRYDTAEEAYAAEFDVSVEEAGERLALQQQLDTTLQQLRQLAGDRFAGNWIEHQPTYRAVVRLTGPVADQEAFEALAADAAAPVEVRTDAPLSLAELQAEREKVQEELRRLLPTASTGIHVQTGSVLVYATTPDNSPQRSTQTTAISEVRALTDAPVRVTNMPGRPQAQNEYGGDALSNCTSGFGVVNGSGVRGIITAGHCGGPEGAPQYQGYAGDVFPLTFQREQEDLTTDIGFYTSTHETVPAIYGSSRTIREVVQGFTEWAGQDVGDWVCHQGKTTGYSCGQITDRTSTSCWMASVCNPTWVVVRSQSLRCAGGDSGGPWFIHGRATAWGIHSAGWTDPDTGQCLGAIYSPIDFKVNATGTQLLVG